MKRCFNAFNTTRRGLVLTMGLLATGLAPLAQAQGLVRNFPDAALRGEMEVVLPPSITMDGTAARLSPGARIRNTSNTIVMSGGLTGQTLVVNYLLAPGGLVHEVWILTEAEAALERLSAADLKN